MTQLTSTGLSVSRLADRLTDLQAAVQAIFGPGLDLSANTIDGQTIGIFAESINNADMLLEEVYRSLDPDGAVGAALSRLARFNGLTRVAGTYSAATVTFGGRVGTSIPAATLVHSTATLAVFQTTAPATIGSTGLVDVACTASLIGAQAAPAASLTEIDTPVFGLQTATNALDAVVGRAVETDGQLRARRQQSTAGPSQSVVDSIYAAIGDLSGVTAVRVYENDQPSADPITGQQANSIYAVVQGGADADIAQVIFLKKPAGIPTVGTVINSVTDSQGLAHAISFSRPVADRIFFTITVSSRPGFPADGAAQIKAAIAAYGTANYTIGQEVIQSDFYGAIASIPGKSVTSILMSVGSFVGGSTANILIPYDHIALFVGTQVNVVVT